jgi:hypothetical protein
VTTNCISQALGCALNSLGGGYNQCRVLVLQHRLPTQWGFDANPHMRGALTAPEPRNHPERDAASATAEPQKGREREGTAAADSPWPKQVKCIQLGLTELAAHSLAGDNKWLQLTQELALVQPSGSSLLRATSQATEDCTAAAAAAAV